MTQKNNDPRKANRQLLGLALGALGVVYGDIGTSPLYALREAFHSHGGHALEVNHDNILGLLSLVFWALIIVISVKYLLFVMRADNRGEGGILALMALVPPKLRDVQGGRWALLAMGLFGAALLYGDGMITPAISVLSAVEGLHVATPFFDRAVVPITLAILVGLFLIQRKGTAGIGAVFGPVMLLWFTTLAVLGLMWSLRQPEVFSAVNPAYAFKFFLINRWTGFLTLGAVTLVVTGGEALYADMGHFGRRPIQLAWFTMVLPCLLLNYFGQGALLLRRPEAVANPFYLLAPRWALYPLLILATLAAIVASQALISGVFSLAQQAVQLGFSPRTTIVHTSAREHGQIYVPQINKLLMVGTLLIVAGFKSSGALGAAYGIAVTGTMAITTLLFAVVARTRWGWPLWRVVALATFFFVFDFAFLGANALKIVQGGWVPLAIATGVLTLMTTWKVGRERLYEIMKGRSLPIELLLSEIERRPPPRVAGTAVFLTSDAEGASVVLLHHLKHNKALHEQVVLLSVKPADVPYVEGEERVTVKPLGQGFFRVVIRSGFMETPDVPELLALGAEHGLRTKLMETSYYLGREQLIPAGTAKMAGWRKKLFVLMSRNAQSAARFFGLPSNRVVELGAQIEF
ncbi:MAG: potassium transporter Kup [Myxococcales bacterium]